MIFDFAVDQQKADEARQRVINYADGLEKAFEDRYQETVRSTRWRTDREIQTTIAFEKAEELAGFCVAEELVDKVLQKETLLKIDDARTVPLRGFKARQTAIGVEVEIIRGQLTEVYEGAFGPLIPRLNGNIYRRIGRKQYPIQKLRDLKVKEIQGIDKRAFEEGRRHAQKMLKAKMQQAINDAKKITRGY